MRACVCVCVVVVVVMVIAVCLFQGREGFLCHHYGEADVHKGNCQALVQVSSLLSRVHYCVDSQCCSIYIVVNFDLPDTRHPVNEPCLLLPEIDGVRLLTNSTCEFIHRVSCES